MSVNFNATTPSAPAGSTNGTFQTDGSGNISVYLPTSAPIVFTSLNPTLTANFNGGSSQTLFTPTAAGAWRISWAQMIVVAAGVSSTFPSLTLAWTDPGTISRTQTLVSTSTTNTTAVISEGDTIIYTNASGPVSVTSASYASNPASTMTYALAIIAEQI